MQAIGLIETKGLIASIESADVMLKAADVKLISKTLVGGGLVTITVEGDVAAVKASVDAAVSAVERLGMDLLISNHVISRSVDSIRDLFDEKDKVYTETSCENIIERRRHVRPRRSPWGCPRSAGRRGRSPGRWPRRAGSGPGRC